MRKTSLFLSLALSTQLFADSDLLKNTKREFLENSRAEAEAIGEATKTMWLGGIDLSGSYETTETDSTNKDFESYSVKNYSARISQDIFRSGGIWWQIKKGKVLKSLTLTKLDASEKDMIFSLYSIVLSIHTLDIELKKMELLIENQNILIKNQKESYESGLLGIKDLDESIIELNTLKNQKEGIFQTRIDLIANMKNITDLQYSEIDIPSFQIPTIDDFLQKSYELDIQEQEIENMRLDKNLAYAQFLPRVSVYGTYNRSDAPFNRMQNQNESYSYGIQLNIPIGFNAAGAIESAQLAYLRSKSELSDKKETEKVKYEKIVSKLKSIDRRKQNSEELIESYLSVQKITEDYFNSNLRTADDVKIIKNRVQISRHDLEIYELDKKLVLIELYKGIKN
jgi:outer membrane protein TolC